MRSRRRRRLRSAALAALALSGTVVGCTSPTEPDPPDPTAAAEAPETTDDPACDVAAPAPPPCLAWSASGVTPPLAAGPAIVATTVGRDVIAYATADGTRLWDAAPDDPGHVPTGLQVVPAGVLVTTTAVTTEGPAQARTMLLGAADGRLRWVAPGLSTVPTPGGEVVGLVAEDRVTAVDVASGDALWQRPVDGVLGTRFDDEDALVNGPSSVALVAARTGEVRWEMPRAAAAGALGARGSSVAASVVVVLRDGDRVLVDRGTGEVVSTEPLPSRLDVADGQLIALSDTEVWGVTTAGSTSWSRPGRPLVARGGTALLLGAERDGREAVALLDPATGDVLWEVDADRDVREVVADDDVVALVRPGSVVLRDRATGQELETVTAPDPVVVSLAPVVVASDDTLAVLLPR